MRSQKVADPERIAWTLMRTCRDDTSCCAWERVTLWVGQGNARHKNLGRSLVYRKIVGDCNWMRRRHRTDENPNYVFFSELKWTCERVGLLRLQRLYLEHSVWKVSLFWKLLNNSFFIFSQSCTREKTALEQSFCSSSLNLGITVIEYIYQLKYRDELDGRGEEVSEDISFFIENDGVKT